MTSFDFVVWAVHGVAGALGFKGVTAGSGLLVTGPRLPSAATTDEVPGVGFAATGVGFARTGVPGAGFAGTGVPGAGFAGTGVPGAGFEVFGVPGAGFVGPGIPVCRKFAIAAAAAFMSGTVKGGAPAAPPRFPMVLRVVLKSDFFENLSFTLGGLYFTVPRGIFTVPRGNFTVPGGNFTQAFWHLQAILEVIFALVSDVRFAVFHFGPLFGV